MCGRNLHFPHVLIQRWLVKHRDNFAAWYKIQRVSVIKEVKVVMCEEVVMIYLKVLCPYKETKKRSLMAGI